MTTARLPTPSPLTLRQYHTCYLLPTVNDSPFDVGQWELQWLLHRDQTAEVVFVPVLVEQLQHHHQLPSKLPRRETGNDSSLTANLQQMQALIYEEINQAWSDRAPVSTQMLPTD